MPVKLKCPDCRKTFPWAANEDWPRFCPMCRADINNDRDDDDIVMPFIRASSQREKNQASDAVYRQMETSSEQRAQMAASHLNVSAADVSDLKITNLKDARRPGEVAAPPVVNDVSKMIDKGVGGFQGQNGSEFAAGTKVGHYPNAGARTLQGIQRMMGK